MAMRSRLTLSAVAVSMIAWASLPASAERAASIEYVSAERPANLPQDFTAPQQVDLRFLSLTALDKGKVDAALWQPRGKEARDTVLVVSVHGSGDNYVKPPVGFLSAGLAERGYGVLAINTRQHDAKVNTDNFLEVRRDIEAAVYTARALGYRRTVLHGHSLGNIQTQYYAANNWDEDIKGLVLTGMFGNLPWKSRHVLAQDEDNYRQLIDAALSALKKGDLDQVLPVRMNWITGQKVPMTAQHVLTYRSEASSVADGTYWIKRVPVPVLMVRDAGDAIVAPFEPYMLLSAATSSGSLVPEINYLKLPNSKGVSPAAHYFVDNKQALVEAVAEWLARFNGK